MNKLLLLAFCFILLNQANAQFGNTPQILTKSPNSNQLGIWTADIDADGDGDILVAHQNSLTWYKNLGGGNFSNDYELIAANMFSSHGFLGGKFEDIDADGLPDLIFDRYWRKGLGNGEFAPQSSILAGSLATLCDVDSDGMQDAISRDNNRIYWQRNLGMGKFATRQTLATVVLSEIHNIEVDLNSDGHQDFIAQHNNNCYWYKNLGNSQFDTIRLLTGIPSSITHGDIDENGKPDLFIGVRGSIFWYEFDSSDQPTLRQTLPKYYFGETSLGDLDGDGDLDLFVGSIEETNQERAKFFAFDSDIGLFDTVPINHNNSIINHRFSEILDLNGDGLPDILTGDYVGTGQLGWIQNLGSGNFSAVKTHNRKLGLPLEIEIADLENDGDMDIFAVGIVLENLGNGQYAEKRPGSPGSGSRSFYGDIDGDGIKDLALPNGDYISWQKGLGNGQFAAAQILEGLVTSCKQVGGGDLDRDGDIDLFAANGTETVEGNARFYWFENDGAGNFTPHLLATGIQFCFAIFALDSNTDGWLDIGLLFFNGISPSLYLNEGAAQFAPPTYLFGQGIPSPSNVNQFMFTDLDGDGRLDYIFSTDNLSSTKVAWFQNLGPAGFSQEKSLATMAHQGSSAAPRFCVFDANLDGITDVVVSDNYWNRFLLVRGLGNSSFAPQVTLYDEPNFGNFYGVAPHDVDGDGRLDIVYGEDTDRLTNNSGYHRISWLKNEYPLPVPGIQTIFNNSTCDDNNTPLDATDDRQVLHFKVTTIGNGAFSNHFILFDELAQTALDTFLYDFMDSYTLAPGSAGISNSRAYSFRDLNNPDLKKTFNKPAINTCSPEAPTAIGVNFFKATCDDSYTPDDTSDDRIKFEIIAAIYNDTDNSFSYSLNSNLGTPVNILNDGSVGLYLEPDTYYLPDGSAGVAGQVTITIEDQMNPGISKTIIFDNPGTCFSVPPPCPADIYYTKQRQVDLFPITYPSCKVIEGSVKIRQSTIPGAPELENLNGFSNLEYIKGDLIIDATMLPDLKGLELLEKIGGDLLIYDNPELINLSGLNNLGEIGKNFQIYEAPSLVSLSGLESLNQIEYDLLLQHVPALTDLSALENLINLNGSLWIQNADSLKSLEGLDNLINIGTDAELYSGLLTIIDCPSLENLGNLTNLKSISSLVLQGNAQLKSLSGLENLDSIREELTIVNNPFLENLDELSNVKSTLKHFFYIQDNDLLTNLDGIRNINLMSLTHLEISFSESLSGCSQANICEYLDTNGSTGIQLNKFGCNSTAEIQAKCQVPLTAFLEGSTEICLGDSTELSIIFEGLAPYSFTLAENGTPLPTVITSENPYLIEVYPDIQTEYSIVNVSNELGNGLAGGSALILPHPLPDALINAPDTVCLGDTIIITASGGVDYAWSTGQQGSEIELIPASTETYSVTVTDGNLCSSSTTKTIEVKECTVGIFSSDDHDESGSFQVFPNPLSKDDLLQISLENEFIGELKIEFSSLDGRVLKTVLAKKDKSVFTEQFTIDAAWPGQFIVRVTDGERSGARLVMRF